MEQGLFTRIEKKTSGQPRTMSKAESRTVPLHLLHKQECLACPLNTEPCRSPKMKPTGSSQPLIYVLGEAPGREEDETGRQFVGQAGRLLRSQLPQRWLDRTRFNNCIRTRPPDNRTPDFVEIECCRPSIVRDIEQSKPRAIFGFGSVPLNWALGASGATGWHGRRAPVKIGNHTCWYFSFVHPSFVNRNRTDKGRGEDWEGTFKRDFARALAELEYLPEPFVESVEALDDGITLIDKRSLEQLFAALKQVDSTTSLCIDLETTELRPYTAGAKILTAAVSIASAAFSFPWKDPRGLLAAHEIREVATQVKRALLAAGEVTNHNTKFDMEWLAGELGEDILWEANWHCTQNQAYILDERSSCQSLNDLCILHLGLPLKKHAGVDRADLQERKSLTQGNLTDVLRYGGRDAKYTHIVHSIQLDLIEQEGLYGIYDLHRQRLPALVAAQRKGMAVDDNKVREYKLKYQAEADRLLALIQNLPEIETYRRRFGEFNVDSPHDLVKMFRDVLERPEGRNDRNSKYSTDEETLAQMTGVPMARMLVERRKVSKLLSTYVDPLDRFAKGSVVYPDGKVHTNFNSTFTVTGRLSSDDPNMQNFPKRKNPHLRAQLTARAGHVLIAADYGQIEARGIGIASGDEFLINALWTEYDIHMYWAERIAADYPGVFFELDLEEGNMKALRSEVKNKLVFPAFYGSVESSINRDLHLPEHIGHEIYHDFWDQFKGVKKWQKELLRFYEKYGYVESLLGRRRRGAMTANMVINSTIQGFASDIVVDAMVRLGRVAYELSRPWLQALLNIHDDLTFEVPDDRVDDASQTIGRQMCLVPFDCISVPIVVEMSIGRNWFEMKHAHDFKSHQLN